MDNEDGLELPALRLQKYGAARQLNKHQQEL